MHATLAKWGGLLAGAALLTGCAFTKETVQLKFQPPTFADAKTPAAAIVVEKLRDVRGVDPHLLAQKGVQAKTTGTYLTEREVADLVTDALRDTLRALHYQVAPEGPLTLSGDLIKFDSAVIVGFWAGAMEGSIQLNLKLTDSQNGTILWTELLSGYSRIEGLQVDRAAHRQQVAEAALQDVMKKLGQSDTLRKVVQSR